MYWRDFVRNSSGRVREVGRLARWRLFGLISLVRPEHLRLRPPPWRPAPVPALATPAATKVPITRPAVYGDVVPKRYINLAKEAVCREPGLPVVDDVVIVPGHVFVDRRRGQILPQSNVDTTTSSGVTGRETRPPKLSAPPQEAEELFVVDSHYPGYGHYLLEALPRLLLLDKAPAGIEIATSVPRSPTFDTLVRGMGVDPSRVRHFHEPLFCRRAYLPDRLVHLDRFIHPAALEAFGRLRTLGAASDVERSERIFISRSRIRRRRLRNEAEIEALFERYGFRIVHPELLPIEAQIALFSDARMIAGLGGSAMHSTVFSDPAAKVLMISAKQWFVETDVLINRNPGQLGYVFGEPVADSADVGNRSWEVDSAAVEAAVVAHFGL